jgi:uncharacterized membrane protein
MRRWIVIVVTVAIAGPGRAQPAGDARDPGADVRRVFAAKCTGCHGSDVPKPKGRFGYVLDLPRVAGNPEMVIPGRPEESELWALVQHGDMPPPDSPRGPLSAAEKDTIRTWIAAGAPDVRTVGPDPEQLTTAPVELAPADRWVRFLGKFHLLLLHFPIALLIAAGIGEGLAVCRGSRVPSPVVLFCVMIAALAAVPTVALGWLHAEGGNGIGARQILSIHRWLGTATGLWVLVTAACVWRDARRGVRSWGVRAALAVGIVLVVGTAHAGGLLAHGRDFFEW